MVRRHIFSTFFLMLLSAKMMRGEFQLSFIDPLHQINDHSHGIFSHALNAASKARNYFKENAASHIFEMFSIGNQKSHMSQPVAALANLDDIKQIAGNIEKPIFNNDGLKDITEIKTDVSPLNILPAAEGQNEQR